MGGIQVILVGDLFQLPPANNEFNSFIFKSKTWKELDLKICYLSEQHRQAEGDELNSILQGIRNNRLSETELDVLKSKVNSILPHRNNILRLYSHNFDADKVNNLKLGRLSSKGKLYKTCLLYTSPSPRDRQKSRMPSS